jgi:hypothetical protein
VRFRERRDRGPAREDGQVFGQYGLLFAKNATLDPAFHRLLLNAFRFRQVGDYEARADISTQDVTRIVAEGRRFLAAAVAWLAAR